MSSDVIEQVAMVSGRILHRGTGRPIDGSVTIEAAEGPVILKLFGDGTFALSADTHRFRSQIEAGTVTLSLTLRARSQELTTGAVTESFVITVPAGSFPADQGDWKLPRVAADAAANLARTIRGRVTAAEDPQPPIAGATVEILHADGAITSTSTNTDGWFSFDDVVVEAPAEIRVTEATVVPRIRELWIDFALGMHEEHFRMVKQA